MREPIGWFTRRVSVYLAQFFTPHAPIADEAGSPLPATLMTIDR